MGFDGKGNGRRGKMEVRMGDMGVGNGSVKVNSKVGGIGVKDTRVEIREIGYG